MLQFSPHVTPANTAHVHHMLVYICDSLNTTDPGGPCDDVSDGLSSCLGGTLIAAWAVGGQVVGIYHLCVIFHFECRISYIHLMLPMDWEAMSIAMHSFKCTTIIQTDYQVSQLQ